MRAERLWHLYFGALEDADELEGVDHGFALIVIVGDDKGVASVFGDFADAPGPGTKFFRRIEIVVAFVGRDGGVVGEPGVVPAAVEADVADGRGGRFGRLERTADDGLVNVAETRPVLAQQGEGIGMVPRSVTHLDDEGIVAEALQERREMSDGFGRAMERKRELQENRSKLASFMQRVESCANGALVFGGGAGQRRNSAVRDVIRNDMRESLPEFGGEDEPRIGHDAVDPLRGVVQAKRLVKRGVDLDGVEEFREIRRFVKAFGPPRGIHVAGPVRVGPARWADADDLGWLLLQGFGSGFRRCFRHGFLPGFPGRRRGGFFVATWHLSSEALLVARRVEFAERCCQRRERRISGDRFAGNGAGCYAVTMMRCRMKICVAALPRTFSYRCIHETFHQLQERRVTTTCRSRGRTAPR